MNIFTLRKRINLTVGAVILLTGSIASSYPDDIAQLDFSPV
jgi:hypothetical protein